MEPLIVIVGFLGAGKTTFMKKLVNQFLHRFWNPYVILNDYQNAQMDAQFFSEIMSSRSIDAISGSCICCSGVTQLRDSINQVPQREKGITFIEANGTTDAYTLMGFLGVGIKDQFQPPIQVALVDVRFWQNRGADNELEASQVEVSSLIVLNRIEDVTDLRLKETISDIRSRNPTARITQWEDFDETELLGLQPLQRTVKNVDHHKSHWSSCSVNLPDPISQSRLTNLLEQLPGNILRFKGCTKIDNQSHYTFFERTPAGEIEYRPFYGNLVSGPKIILIGPGSDPEVVEKILDSVPV